MRLNSRLAPMEKRPPPDFGLAQVNIVLLLVLFFLVVGTIVETDELAVDLSVTEDLPLERLPRPLLLIDPEGNWALDGTRMSRADVLLALSDQPDDITMVHILAPKTMPADALVAVLQQLEQTPLGATLVTLKTGQVP